MKNLCMLALSLLLLAGCANNKEEVLISEVVIQPCAPRKLTPTTVVIKFNNKLGTIRKFTKEDAIGNINTTFIISVERETGSYYTCNLPESLQIDGQKILFNGSTIIDTNPLVCIEAILEFNSIKLVK